MGWAGANGESSDKIDGWWRLCQIERQFYDDMVDDGDPEKQEAVEGYFARMCDGQDGNLHFEGSAKAGYQ
jgi:hypothetical protein